MKLVREWFETNKRKLFFYTEDSELLEFVLTGDKVWRQCQTGIRQIQEQPVYKQILERMCRDVPFDVPSPVVMVAGGEQEEQTVQGGQEHVCLNWCFLLPLSQRRQWHSCTPDSYNYVLMLFLELGNQICQMLSQTRNMECIFHDLPPSPKCKAFILILLPGSFINFFRLGKQK